MVDCDYQGLVESLKVWTCQQVRDEPVRLLRCYWYDGARDGIPTDEHLRVARLADEAVLGRGLDPRRCSEWVSPLWPALAPCGAGSRVSGAVVTRCGHPRRRSL